jgi:SAM-dependent methyltransferase
MRCRDADQAAHKSWQERYQGCECVGGDQPSSFLVEHMDLLPRGRALDIAMGEGRNALFLARQGYQVTGVEREGLAIERALRKLAQEEFQMEAVQADLELAEWRPTPQSFDLVVVVNYLQRDLFGPLQDCLRPGGALVYETTTSDHPGALRPEFKLKPQELLTAFPALRVMIYREVEGRAGLIALRP